jgi:peptidoglycan/xylan/chitin deacetylase (PgdA/CDA1 family)
MLFILQRRAHCAYVPIISENLLPNAELALPDESATLPRGWHAAAPGVKTGQFALDGDERSIHLMGIANYVQTPPIEKVQPGQFYCFSGYAITDSEKGSPTRARVAFHWHNADGQVVAVDITPWQPVVLWQPDAPPEEWSRLVASFEAPESAHSLHITIHPASDDRVYLDVMSVRQGGTPHHTPAVAPRYSPANEVPGVKVAPWPAGNEAAVSFSFDWETTMAGLIHSRSVGDPYSDTDPVLRGLRMREGITTTLNLFRPYGVRATYYTAGYTLLLSNTNQVEFMGNPTYAWATVGNRWTSNHWATTPWFAPDPHGTVESHPSWYAGDLVSRVQQAQHDIQSHTFSHFYGGFVQPGEWRADLATWNQVAGWRGVKPPRSLAFPWSSSGGMSYAEWDILEEAGITSVTRLSDQSQYNLFPTDEHGLVREPRCIPLPGHETILACPDFYLTPESAERAIEQIDRAREVGGMIDLWAHTEEVISPEQRAAWEKVVRYAATQPGVWVAPLREIANWQQAREQVRLEMQPREDAVSSEQPLHVTITNASNRALEQLTMRTAHPHEQVTIDGQEQQPGEDMEERYTIMLDIQAGQTRAIQVWLAP